MKITKNLNVKYLTTFIIILHLFSWQSLNAQIPIKLNPKKVTEVNPKTTPVTNQTQVTMTTMAPPIGVITITGFNFEKGKISLSDWIREGLAFVNQPTYGNNVLVKREMTNTKNPFRVNIPLGGDYWQMLSLPIGHKGEYWIGSAESRSDSSQPLGRMIGDGAPGTLTSPEFLISSNFISFLVGGSNDVSNASVELLLEGESSIDEKSAGNPNDVQTINNKAVSKFPRFTGNGSNVMRRVWWNVSTIKGKKARIMIMDKTTSGNINVDDFIFQDIAPDVNSIAINSKIKAPQVFMKDGFYYDYDFPLWGTIDTHTHPAAHIGFGNRLFHGEPVGNISKALVDCEIDHGADINRRLTSSTGEVIGGKIARNAVAAVFDEGHRLGIMDPGNTWGSQEQTLAYWPLYSTKLHQQMWKDWLKRTFDGGVRMIVALTVHNRLFARISEGTRPDDDASVSRKQIEYIKNVMAPECREWMEIAYSPMDMRRIMLSGKMAVVLGTEIDNIGNFDGRRLPTEIEVRKAIQDLYNTGIRYMFPVHLIDNGFGGSAVKNDIFNIATKYNTRSPLKVDLVDYNYGQSEFRLKAHWDVLNVLPAAVIDAGSKATAYAGIAGLAFPVAAPAVMPLIPIATGAAATGIGLTAPLLPLLVSVGAGVAIQKWTNDWGLSLDIIPAGNNYPTYPWRRYAGHINRQGLTKAGEVAIDEMMRLGVMIDIDHAGRKTVDSYFQKAFSVPDGGYPLNSGHNQFAETRWKEAQLMPNEYDLNTKEGRELYTNNIEHIEDKLGNENDRMLLELLKIKALGGMMGVGISGANVQAADKIIPFGQRKYINSIVANNNPGSSKSAAQLLLYAIEKMKGSSVCFGTDINGFAGLVGPRFGANSASSAAEDLMDSRYLSSYYNGQSNAINYIPFTDLSGKRFRGKLTGKLFDEEYGDFMIALQVYYAMDARYKTNAESGETKNKIDWYINNVVHDGYDRNKVKEFIKGLIKGGTGEGIGTDFGNGDVGTQQQLACKISYEKIFNKTAPDGRFGDVAINGNGDKYKRYVALTKAFAYYKQMFTPGSNIPLLPSSTKGKTWNYNIDGMAHYGLMVDFFQDLKNVGMSNKDMSVLFNSAEDFAKMWERCLRQSDNVR